MPKGTFACLDKMRQPGMRTSCYMKSHQENTNCIINQWMWMSQQHDQGHTLNITVGFITILKLRMFQTHGGSPPNPVICKCTSKLMSNDSLQKAPCVHTSILRAQKMPHICRCTGERQRVPVTIETLPLLLAEERVREDRVMSRCLLSILRINDSWTNKLQIFLFRNHVFITMLDSCPAFCFRMQDK